MIEKEKKVLGRRWWECSYIIPGLSDVSPGMDPTAFGFVRLKMQRQKKTLGEYLLYSLYAKQRDCLPALRER